jgi:short-subunit dehydrogenase
MNRIICITGASSGIGRALAEFFHQEHDTVLGISRSYPQDECHFDYFLCDVADEENVVKTFQKIREKYDHMDVLINCAGMGISGAIEHASLDEVKRIFAVNVFGAFLVSKHAMDLLRNAKHPKIINVGSVAGELTLPFQAFYSMTKSSLHTFSEALRMELRPFSIDVCTVMPGDTKTAFTRNRLKSVMEKDPFYHDRVKRSLERMEKDEQNGKSPFSVVRVVDKLLKKRRMPVSVSVGFKYKWFVFLSRILPNRLVNDALFQMYGK